MKISKTLSDRAALQELGSRLEQRRLDLGLTQAELAREAGLSKRTVERVEAGDSAQLSSLIRLLRSLDLLDRLDSVIPEAATSPMALLKLKSRRRQRASSRKPKPSEQKWTWGDDS